MKKYNWGEDPEMSGPRNYFRESLMVNAFLKYKTKGQILDAGCGSGNLSFRLASKGLQLTSLDLAEKSLRYLKNKVMKTGMSKKIIVKKASLLKVPFKNEQFDGVVCGEVLEHIQQDAKVIGEFFRILKKNGICVITVPGHPELWDVSDEISGHERRYTKESLKDKFQKKGFTVEYCNYWGFPLNNLWHNHIFLPFLATKMENQKNITSDNSLKAKLTKSLFLQKLVSYIFYVDFLFSFTGKGNALLLIARKGTSNAK